MEVIGFYNGGSTQWKPCKLQNVTDYVINSITRHLNMDGSGSCVVGVRDPSSW